jgi:hypothetical protein
VQNASPAEMPTLERYLAHVTGKASAEMA